jgi:hypothetical protein
LIGKVVILVLVLSLLCTIAGAAPLIYGTAYSGAHSAATLYSISPSTGAATAVGPIGFDHVDVLAFAPNGTLYGVGQNGADKWVLLKIDLLSGAGTAIGPTGLETSFQDIAFRSDGTLFGFARPLGQKSKAGLVYSIDTSTGTGRLVGNLAVGVEDGAPVAFSSENRLYTVNQRSLGTIAAANAGPVTALHYSPAFGSAQPQANAVKFDPSSGMLWALVGTSGGTGGDYVATIDVKTGAVAPVVQTTAGLHSLAIEPNVNGPPPTPLPSSLIFLVSGMLALLGWNLWTRFRRPSGQVSTSM